MSRTLEDIASDEPAMDEVPEFRKDNGYDSHSNEGNGRIFWDKSATQDLLSRPTESTDTSISFIESVSTIQEGGAIEKMTSIDQHDVEDGFHRNNISSPTQDIMPMTPGHTAEKTKVNALRFSSVRFEEPPKKQLSFGGNFRKEFQKRRQSRMNLYQADENQVQRRKSRRNLYESKESEGDDTPEITLRQKMVAEVIGTFLLVLFGCGSVCVAVYTGALVGLGQATTIWTLGGALAIYSVGSISGGHLNPAVTLAFAVVRSDDFPRTHILPYWFSQLFGAFLAGAVNYLLFFQAIANFEEANDIVRGDDSTGSAVGFGTYWSSNVAGASDAVLIEMAGTAMLTFVIFSATHKDNNVPSSAVPALVGIAIGSIIAIIGSLSGGAINPARDLGPRLVTLAAGWGADSMKGAWAYQIGPFVGGVLGAILSDKLLRHEHDQIHRA